MNNLDFPEIVVNKMTAIAQVFPIDNRRCDGLPNPRKVRLVQVLTNLILTRIQKEKKLQDKGTVTITFCLQSDPEKVGTVGGWQGVIEEKYPDVLSSINSIREAIALLEAMGAVVWETQGRHRAGKLYCNVETLLLVDQVCMKLSCPDLEPVQGEMMGDEQLSPEYWQSHQKPSNPLRSTLRWIGKIARRVFEQLPRLFEFVMVVRDEMVALWDESHTIEIPPQLPDTEMGFSWVDDKWLELGEWG